VKEKEKEKGIEMDENDDDSLEMENKEVLIFIKSKLNKLIISWYLYFFIIMLWKYS
jgi:hypothetical protein